jgi:hypothetical protein
MRGAARGNDNHEEFRNIGLGASSGLRKLRTQKNSDGRWKKARTILHMVGRLALSDGFIEAVAKREIRLLLGTLKELLDLERARA